MEQAWGGRTYADFVLGRVRGSDVVEITQQGYKHNDCDDSEDDAGDGGEVGCIWLGHRPSLAASFPPQLKLVKTAATMPFKTIRRNEVERKMVGATGLEPVTLSFEG